MLENINGVMLQGFHWFLDKDDQYQGGDPLWDFLGNQADHFRDIGVDAVWIPPAYKGRRGDTSAGYDVYDHFDLGEFNQKNTNRTKYGTKDQLHNAINALHGYKKSNGNLVKDGDKKYIQVYGDTVVNHKDGGEIEDHFWQAIRVKQDNRREEKWEGYEGGLIEVKGYTKFIPKNDSKRRSYSDFEWHARHFDGIDTVNEIKQNGDIFTDSNKYVYRFLYNEGNYSPPVKSWDTWVSLEKGNYDYFMCCDIDFDRWGVKEEIKKWGEWITKEIGLDGFRIDAVKHISSEYIREWLGHVRAKTGKKLFAVGEHLTEDSTSKLHTFITKISSEGEYPQDICLFDFPLRTKFRNASWQGDTFDLRGLNYNTLMAEQPAKAVTFVENHDKEYGRDLDSHVRAWFKPLAYAFILLRDRGYPCIFFPDYYGSHDSDHHKGQPEGKEYLQLLLKLRKQFALGEERYYADHDVAGWVRMGGVEGAKGAMAVVISNSKGGVEAIRMDTGRINKKFYHLATIKYDGSNYVVVKYKYDMYGDKADGLYTDSSGWGDFIAECGTTSIWIENGVGVD